VHPNPAHLHLDGRLKDALKKIPWKQQVASLTDKLEKTREDAKTAAASMVNLLKAFAPLATAFEGLAAGNVKKLQKPAADAQQFALRLPQLLEFSEDGETWQPVQQGARSLEQAWKRVEIPRIIATLEGWQTKADTPQLCQAPQIQDVFVSCAQCQAQIYSQDALRMDCGHVLDKRCLFTYGTSRHD
jgi:hypothetical protein